MFWFRLVIENNKFIWHSGKTEIKFNCKQLCSIRGYIIKGYIYSHINKVNGKRYIGQTTMNPPNRRWDDGEKSYRYSTKLKAAIQKYGWDNFDHIILEEIEESDKQILLDRLNILEENYILSFDSINNGYNLITNGTNHIVSDETRKKLHNYVYTEEQRKRCGDSTRGKHWYTNGIVQIKRFECPDGFVPGRISSYNKPKIVRRKRSDGISEEHRKKLSESHKGKIPWNKGKIGLQKHSDDTKQKISNSKIGKRMNKETRKYN